MEWGPGGLSKVCYGKDVFVWPGVPPWRLPSPVVDMYLLGWVKDGLEGLSPAKKVKDILQKEWFGVLKFSQMVWWIPEVERVVVCSDLAAALGALSDGSWARPDLILNLYMALHRVECTGGSVGFIWVPAHVGVDVNERVDGVANRALEQDEVGVIVDLGVVEWQGRIQIMVDERWQEAGGWRQEADTFIRYRRVSGERGWHWVREGGSKFQ